MYRFFLGTGRTNQPSISSQSRAITTKCGIIQTGHDESSLTKIVCYSRKFDRGENLDGVDGNEYYHFIGKKFLMKIDILTSYQVREIFQLGVTLVRRSREFHVRKRFE